MAAVKVSLVATVKDAGLVIEDFLASLAWQTRAPDEAVIVDGGSSDGTLEALQRAPGLTVLSEPGANIARGRAAAVRSATHDVIAVTDADCVLAPDWLERLMAPIEAGADVSAGFYRPIAESLFQLCAAAALPEANELRAGWMPSARSIAFRREAYEAAGGYPEWLDVGEDMYLNHRFAARGARIDIAPGAVVYWRMRPDLASLWKQYMRYAEGDALGGMYPERHLIRFATYAALVGAILSGNRWLLGAAVAGGLLYCRRPTQRTWRRLPAGSADRWRALAGVPGVMAFTDAAKMFGYARGLARVSDPPLQGRS